MELKRNLKVTLKEGLHLRVIAAIVREAVLIEKKYNMKFYIEYKNKGITPIGAFMSFVFYKVKYGDEITLHVKGEKNLNEALDEIEKFFYEDLDDALNIEIKKIDNLIMDEAITLGEIINSIDNGIIIEGLNNEISFINKSTIRLLNSLENKIIGQNIEKIFDSIKEVAAPNKGKVFRGKKGEKTFLIYKKELITEEKIKGYIYVLDDVSILEEIIEEFSIVKELKEKLQLILDSVGDGVSVINKNGDITYVNENYKRMVGSKELVGKNIYDISPKGVRRRVLEEGKAAVGEIVEKNNSVSVVCSVYPLIVAGKIEGVVSFLKEFADVKQLTNKLDKVSERVKYLEEELIRAKKPDKSFNKYIGKSGAVLDSLALATKAAKSNATVIIRGESGTGKELIAEGIHYASNKSKGPFIRVNCAAIPTNLIESELFGYEKGAFTGAVKRKLGKFELAQDGTLFLDEIGEMDKNMQSKILRVLQYKEFQPVGGEKTIKVNVRIITATHRNLEKMVKEGDFREDLYYRLNVIPIKLPALRDRKEDIPLLVYHFIDKFSVDKNKIKITQEAMKKLVNYQWDGNVRELENIIERTIALSDKDIIEIEDLPSHILDSNEIIKKEQVELKEKNIIVEEKEIIKDEISEEINSSEIKLMKDYEKMIIEKALKKYGSYNKAAKALGLTHRTVAQKAKNYGIEKIITWK
ncbi:MAG: sigma 54-interacting transcriptional regulator [Sarcina sp.]